ncbi:hypothetical protein NKR19_g2534 [Coniochaeta hoffmannii]|uniref:Myb-like domain-containing protein n=1 Tax=Coniochaeta hoffmannii TaxID=91930 RepID=A0AA38VZQ2_9PEZI|nr:hypothetical protein NKR19_g2534 [Coniochaeta hoffmannii]
MADVFIPKTLQHDSRHSATGASQDDAFLISSDDESDYDYSDEDQFNTTFPSISELGVAAGCSDSKCSSIAGDQSFIAASGASGDSDAKEPSVTDGVDADDEIASGWQQQTPGLERPSAPPRPSASPEPFQAECDQQVQLSPARNHPSHPENTPCLEDEAEQSPGPQREESPSRGSTPWLDAASQSHDWGGQAVQKGRTRGASDDGVGLPRAFPQSKRMRKTVHSTCFPDRPRDADSDDDGLGQKSDDYGDSRADTVCDGTDVNGTDGEDSDSEEDYRPPSPDCSDGELDEDDDFGAPPSKRRKTVAAIPATPKTTATQRLCSSGPAAQPREVQSLTHGGKRSPRRSIPSPLSSRASHDGKGAVGAVSARFEEWPLENVSLKRVTENGVTTFQLQFSWDSCEHATESPRSESPVKKRNLAKRGATARAVITPDEDDLLIRLKEVDKLRWQEIHKKFTEAFPGRKRSVATLQVRYCTKLKQRDCGDGDGNEPSRANGSRRRSSRVT